MKKQLALLFFIFGLALQYSNACSCTQGTVEQGVKKADAVFVGRVLSKDTLFFMVDNFEKNTPFQAMYTKYDFLVLSTLKGNLTKDTVSIYTGMGNGDCGIVFFIGEKYIIYGEMKNPFFYGNRMSFDIQKQFNAFWTHMCLRTTFFNRKELKAIKKITKKYKHEKNN